MSSFLTESSVKKSNFGRAWSGHLPLDCMLIALIQTNRLVNLVSISICLLNVDLNNSQISSLAYYVVKLLIIIKYVCNCTLI